MWQYTNELIQEYREGIQQLIHDKERLKNTIQELSSDDGKSDEVVVQIHYYEHEIKVISGMISDMQYVVSWLQKGKQPENKKEISNLAVYQRTDLWGDIEQSAMKKFRNSIELENDGLSVEEEHILDEIYQQLSKRQYEAVSSVVGKGNTYEMTAQYMGVTRSTVQSYVNDGMRKIDEILRNGSQMLLL